MSTSAQYASTPKVGSAVLTTADNSLTAPTTVGTVFTAGASGSRIDYIEAIGLSTTLASIINLFIYDGTNYFLWQQVPVTAITTSTTGASFVANLSSNNNANAMPLVIPTGYSLRASITVDQNSILSANRSAAAASANPASGALVTLTTAASATAIAAAATVSSTYYTLTSTPYVMPNPALVSLTSTGNQSAINFTIRGIDTTGTEVSETIAGPNNTTVYSTNVYTQVLSVYTSATMTGTTSVGYGSTYIPALPVKITQTSAATSNSGVTWTIKGVSQLGTIISESLTGAGIGATVTSTNTYRSLTSITGNASATAASFGNANLNGSIRVIAYGGDF
jgi:hypothetical protein